MGETSSQSVVVAVDRIFTGSTRLDGDAIGKDATAMPNKLNNSSLSKSIEHFIFPLAFSE